MSHTTDTTAYRYPNEQLILALTLILVILVIAISATATFCLSAIFIVAMIALSYWMTRSHHGELMSKATQVTQEMPELDRLVRETIARLRPGPVQVFVAPSRELNAYTFGLASPKVVVLHAALFQLMDADEMRFIIGHEMGHVRLGHTWLNSLVGGMAGIPSPYAASALLALAFLWWNRACEYSADRAGLLACGSVHKASSALVKLAAGPRARSQADLEQALRRIEAEDDHFLGTLGEALGTHPMTVRRIEALEKYARTAEYRRLQESVDGNIYG